MRRDYETERVGGEAVCEDWTQIYDWAGANYEEWVEVRDDALGSVG